MSVVFVLYDAMLAATLVAASVIASRSRIFRGIGSEFCFASSAAKQDFFVLMEETIRRIRFWNHAANGISLLRIVVVPPGCAGIHCSDAVRCAPRFNCFTSCTFPP